MLHFWHFKYSRVVKWLHWIFNKILLIWRPGSIQPPPSQWESFTPTSSTPTLSSSKLSLPFSIRFPCTGFGVLPNPIFGCLCSKLFHSKHLFVRSLGCHIIFNALLSCFCGSTFTYYTYNLRLNAPKLKRCKPFSHFIKNETIARRKSFCPRPIVVCISIVIYTRSHLI